MLYAVIGSMSKCHSVNLNAAYTMKRTAGSQTVEDYLKAIYALEEEFGRAKTSMLAGRLDLTPGTVTEMVKRLAATDPPLVDYRHHRGVMLTPAGKERALHVIRRHRLLETFLNRVLGLGWEEVHQEAEMLEHHLSERVTDAIDHHLGYPQTDPHGEAIPSKKGTLPPVNQTRLSDVDTGQTVRVVRVHPCRDDVLRYLNTLGVGVGTRLVVADRAPLNGPLTLQLLQNDHRGPFAVGRDVADRIFVETAS